MPSVRISGALPLLTHMPYGVRRDNLIRIARFYAAVAYLPSIVPKYMAGDASWEFRKHPAVLPVESME